MKSSIIPPGPKAQSFVIRYSRDSTFRKLAFVRARLKRNTTPSCASNCARVDNSTRARLTWQESSPFPRSKRIRMQGRSKDNKNGRICIETNAESVERHANSQGLKITGEISGEFTRSRSLSLSLNSVRQATASRIRKFRDLHLSRDLQNPPAALEPDPHSCFLTLRLFHAPFPLFCFRLFRAISSLRSAEALFAPCEWIEFAAREQNSSRRRSESDEEFMSADISRTAGTTIGI